MKVEIAIVVISSFCTTVLQSRPEHGSFRSLDGTKLFKFRGALHSKKKNRDDFNNTEVIAQIGGTAALRCHTQKMPDQLVTWMKRGEEQLLTAGLQVYSSEKRYSVAHLRHQKVWELRIRDVQAADAGTYECQLTTYPPVSILFTLQVVEARAAIHGQRELHVHEGSRLKLHCQVDLATEPPLYVFWFHNQTMINFEARRPLHITKQLYGSSLTITNVSRSDAGMYRCEPHLALSDNVTLHVIADANSAAMQKEKDDSNPYSQTSSSSASSSSSSASSSSRSSSAVIITTQIKLLLISLLGVIFYYPMIDLFELPKKYLNLSQKALRHKDRTKPTRVTHFSNHKNLENHISSNFSFNHSSTRCNNYAILNNGILDNDQVPFVLKSRNVCAISSDMSFSLIFPTNPVEFLPQKNWATIGGEKELEVRGLLFNYQVQGRRKLLVLILR